MFEKRIHLLYFWSLNSKCIISQINLDELIIKFIFKRDNNSVIIVCDDSVLIIDYSKESILGFIPLDESVCLAS